MNPDQPATPSVSPAKYTSASFANAIRTKFPNGVGSDGIPYSKLSPEELTRRIVAKYPVYKNQITPTLGEGVSGEAAGNAVRAVAEPLISTGGAIESGLDETAGRIINATKGKGFTPTQSGAGAAQAEKDTEQGASGSIAGHIGSFMGNVAPYFSGLGEEEAGAKIASFIPQLAEKLGMNTETLIPKVASYLAKVAPTVAKNTAIGTAQTGSPEEGATVGVGGQAAGDIIPAVAKGGAELATQVLGSATGAGASSVKAAYTAGKEGIKSFTDALRGKIDSESVVQDVQSAVQRIADSRRSQYLSDLSNVKGQTKSLDISPVHDTLDTQLQNFGVKVTPEGELDFSRSSIANNGSARTDIQGVYNTIKDWGTQAGDRTAVGLDTLKKQLGDFYSPSGSARALVQAVTSKVSDTLKDQVPGYSDMTANYAKASNLLSDIKSATGAGSNAKADTVFTKLTTAMKSDKDLRLQVMHEMTQAGGIPDLEQKIAGINMQSLIPKGLVGKMSDVGAIYTALTGVLKPELLPALAATSPRVVGEFMNGLGVGARYVKPFTDLLTKLPRATIPSAVIGGTAKALNK